jgi:hypothetical protein
MADEVRKQMEMMVPELRDLEERELATARELKLLIKQRRQFEYLLKRRSPRKVDYLRYIAFELNFESLRQKRKARLNQASKGPSDHAGMKRVHLIFDRALRRFDDDTALWLQYMAFCTKTRSTKTLARLFPRALRRHPRNAAIWVRAASWEFTYNSNIEGARVMLQRGLRLNKESPRLWHEYFRFEMLCVAKLEARRAVLGLSGNAGSAAGDALAEGAVPLVVVRNAFAARPNDLDFHLDLLAICDGFRIVAAARIGAAIVEHLEAAFGAHPACWAALASRPLRVWRAADDARAAADAAKARRKRKRKRRRIDAIEGSGSGAALADALAHAPKARRRGAPLVAAERKCVACFERALAAVAPGPDAVGGADAAADDAARCAGVWETYAAWIMERLAAAGEGEDEGEDAGSARAAWLGDTLVDVLARGAARSPALATQRVWTLLSRGCTSDEALAAAAAATSAFPASGAVWGARLALVRRARTLLAFPPAPAAAEAAAEAASMHALCEQAVASVPAEEAGEVWAQFIEWALLEEQADASGWEFEASGHTAVAALFERAVAAVCGASAQRAAAAQALAYRYLAWAWLAGPAYGRAATDALLALTQRSASVVGRRAWSYLLRCEALAATPLAAPEAHRRVRALFEQAIRLDRSLVDVDAAFVQFAQFAESVGDYELAASVRWRASQEAQ